MLPNAGQRSIEDIGRRAASNLAFRYACPLRLIRPWASSLRWHAPLTFLAPGNDRIRLMSVYFLEPDGASTDHL